MIQSLLHVAAAGLFACSLFAPSLAQSSADPIVIKGSKFFYKTNGTEFFIKGIAYQQNFQNDTQAANINYVDPLATESDCARDLPYLQELDTNLIRVYAVDPTLDHSACMNMFADAGIYVLLDLSSPDVSIESDTPEWTTTVYERYTSVIDAFANYTNTFGFFAGNEVVFAPNSTDAAPFVKAAARDMKAYIKSKNYRTIGVGYAADDNQYIRVNMADFMNCGSDQDNAVDFWGYNIYSWCGDSSYAQSGYEERVAEFSNYSIPVFLAEYGCNNPSPRTFGQVPTIYSAPMDQTFSGGIVYLYFQEENNYGLVSIDGSGSVSKLPDFTNLQSQITAVSPTGTNSASYTPSNSPQACPTSQVNFTAVASPLPPTPNSGLCQCMYDSLSCVPASNLNVDDYGDLFNYVCSQGSLCSGIAHNGSTGTYGAFGMCNAQQQLGYALNQYYLKHSGQSTACSFSGSATLQSASTATGSCATALSSASSAAGNSGGSGAGSTTTKGTGAATSTRVFGGEYGYVFAAIFAQAALVSGIGMILL